MFICALVLSASLFTINGQTTLVLKELSGNETVFGLSNIRNITFSDNTLKILKLDKTESSYSIYNVQLLRFGTISTRTENIVDDLSIKISPNPVSDQLNCHFTANTDSRINLQINGANGRIVLQHLYIVQSGSNLITVPLGKLDKGIYFLRITGVGITLLDKFLKK